MSALWVTIEYDDKSGAPTVVVTEEHLQDFPKFMRCVLQQRIGQDVGFFKIRFIDGVQYSSTLRELTEFVNEYYNPPKSRKRKKTQNSTHNVPSVDQQRFFRGANESMELFGYVNVDSDFDSEHTTEAKKQFVSTVSKCESFENQSTCCLVALQLGENELVKHYWETVKSVSHGAQISIEDIQEREDHASNVRNKYVFHEPSNSEDCRMNHDDHSTTENNLLLYGAGIPMRAIDFPVTPKFSLSKLRTILDEYPIETPGISYPFLYVGCTHASFAWHIEDQALFSINMLHFGAPCAWFFVPPKFYKKFVDWLQYMPLAKSQVSCRNVLGHKHVMASEKCLQQLGIPVTTTIQKEKEIVVTYPYAAHSGFKLGFNFQEAANFGDEWWIEPGLFAPTCDCFPSVQINMDMKEIIAIGRPKLHSLYLQNDILGLMAAVRNNPFLKELDLLPISDVLLTKEGDQRATTSAPPPPEIQTDSQVWSASAPSCRPALACPHEGCKTSYQGGNGKVQRLVTHINKCHPDCSHCIESLQEKYPNRVLSEVKRVSCHICGKQLAGSLANVKDHIFRVHN